MSMRVPHGHWNDKENCRIEALKYRTRTAFFKGSRGSYASAKNNGWLDEICSHMPEPKKPLKKEDCQKAALKYSTRSEFNRNDLSAYTAAHRYKWLDEICSHMQPSQSRPYTKEECRQAALNYESRVEFEKGVRGLYRAAVRRDWIDEICAHMTPLRKSHTLESCAKEALKYETRVGFSRGSPLEYDAALYNGWMDTICTHMRSGLIGPRKWPKEACHQEASKYETRGAFCDGSSSAYVVARANGWLNDICGHMLEVKKPKGHWNIETCRQEALLYRTRSEFSFNSAVAYGVARKCGVLDEICGHMEDRSPTDNNLVYIHRAVGHVHQGCQVYKIGISSQRLGGRRKMQLENSLGGELENTVSVPVADGTAFQIEQLLLILGNHPQYTGFDGATEYRALNETELQEALEYLEEHRVSVDMLL